MNTASVSRLLRRHRRASQAVAVLALFVVCIVGSVFASKAVLGGDEEEPRTLAPTQAGQPVGGGMIDGDEKHHLHKVHVHIHNQHTATAAAGHVLPPIGGNGSAARMDLFPSFGYDKSVTEIVNATDDDFDGIVHNVRGTASQEPGAAPAPYTGSRFLTTNEWRGKCWYETRNFCVLNGTLTFFHDAEKNPNPSSHSLRMCNEFSQHSPLIRLRYQSLPLPEVLPAPLYTKTPGWVLQFWCQDLFHMTLTMLPAFHTRQTELARMMGVEPNAPPAVMDAGVHPDIFIRIARGKRKRNAFCKVKLGDPRNWEDVRNNRWGGDTQFPIAGNPYWPFYQVLTPRPDRIFPLYGGATHKSACYTKGVIDKYYIKESSGDQARQYSTRLLDALNVTRGRPRVCGSYRLTLIDRRGKTRRLTNIPELAEAAARAGFEVQPVALETLPIRKQLELISSTDALVGMHGNGITWLQFLPPGSAVVELIGVWYTPYALLWGHKHFHSSMRHNAPYKEGGEFRPFGHNVSEFSELLGSVRSYLDSTSCGPSAYVPGNDRLENLYKSCVPHC